MNWQMEFMRNVMTSASEGRPAAVDLLRDICRRAADAAPQPELLEIAKFLYDLRMDAAKQHIAGN